MSDKAVSFVKRNARRLFELWFYGRIVSEDIKFLPEHQDEYDYYAVEKDESYKKILADLSDTYEIEIVLQQHADYACHAPVESHMRLAAAAILSGELAIYSPSMIKKSRLGKVIMCGGINGMDPRCIGLSIPHAGEIILEFTPLKADWRARRLAVHHEIFHQIDYFDDVLQYMDPWWESFNEKGFAYSQQHLKPGTSTPPGFVSPYAMSAVHEDKAEVFCHMIIEYEQLNQYSQTDAVLRQKVQRMKDLLRQFCPEFDEEFWQKRLNAKQNSRYSCGL